MAGSTSCCARIFVLVFNTSAPFVVNGLPRPQASRFTCIKLMRSGDVCFRGPLLRLKFLGDLSSNPVLTVVWRNLINSIIGNNALLLSCSPFLILC